jgi:hypothetical protein
MPRACTVCNHASREEIEKALLSGGSFRNVAKRFGTSVTALFRHKSDHLPTSLVKAKEAEDIARADSVLGDIRNQIAQITSLYQAAEGILEEAKKSSDLPTALKAIRELSNLHRENRATLELIAKITGEMEKAKQEQQSSTGPAVLILPPQLPPGAPANLERDYWIRQGFTHGVPEDEVQRVLAAGPSPDDPDAPDPNQDSQIIDAEVIEVTENTNASQEQAQ